MNPKYKAIFLTLRGGLIEALREVEKILIAEGWLSEPSLPPSRKEQREAAADWHNPYQ
jgi:hypothetical protein